jgi:hypothetical protein
MNKNPMVLLPIFLVAVLGVYFGYKWWSARTQQLPLQQISDIGAVDDRGQSLLKNFQMDDQNAVQLKATTEASANDYAVVRLSENKMAFTVIALFAKSGTYQVWMTVGDKTTKLGTLVSQKGGYVLDYKSKTVLPESFTVTVSREQKNDATLEEKVLEGIVETAK